uniref:DNA topoisomerase 2-binding protein 1-like n=1 Tax=Saccoglossus kowalevskii TaxID=10224 RepID=A0ABM0MNL6_SACKO|nr:PREDICTED: DNA topoisomerase 2-binding protein 1-like [Saccoglossus kowalevskii]
MAVNDDVKMTSEPSADVDGMSCEAMNTNADVEGVSDEAAVNAVTLSDRRKSGVHCDSNMQVNTNMDKSVVSQNTDISNTAHFSKSRIIVQDNDNGVTEPTPQDVKMSDDTQQETVSHRAKTPVVAPVSFGSATLLCKNDFRPSFDLVCIDTPPGQKAKSQRRRKSSLPLDVMFTNQLKRALERRTNGKTDAINYHHDNNDDDDDEEVFVKQERTGVLNGVIICVSRKLIKKQNEYNNIAAALNAEYLWTYDSRCTHFIHQGRSNDTSKDYKLAKEQKKHIVSPHWLSACKDENKHIDESLYPHTYNPKMSLSVVSKQRRSTRASIKAETTYYSDDDDDNADGGKEDLPQGDTLEIQQDFKRQFDEIMTSALTTKGTRRKSRRLNNSSNSNTGTTTDQDEEISRSSASSREASKTSYHVIAPEHSQTLHITWDDPTGREERQKIMEKLQGGVVNAEHDDNEEDVDEEEEDHHDDNQEDNSLEEPTTPEAPPVRLLLTKPAVALAPEERVYKPPRILLSSMTQQEKIQYGALIEELGGTVSETQYYDRTCTHVVVGSPTRNEKYLAALASGKWVLHKSYLEACRQAEHFIDEYEHEWGNATDLSNRNPQTVKLALAATRWRQRLDEDREASDGGVVGAFKGWKVLLCVDANREAGFKRLLEAGAAQVLCSRPPFTSSEHATHAFLDMGKIRKSKLNVDIAGLVDCGVMCLKAEYIAEYLMVDPLPSAHKYYVDEAREIIQTTNSSEFSAGTPIKRKAVDDEPSESKRSKRY